MTLETLKKELFINEIRLRNATSAREIASLLIQRSNIKDMMIELLERRAA